MFRRFNRRKPEARPSQDQKRGAVGPCARVAPASESSEDNKNRAPTDPPTGERQNRSVNDFKSASELKEALLCPGVRASYSSPVETGCLLSSHDLLQETDFSHDVDTIRMEDVDKKIDWVLERRNSQTTKEQDVDQELKRLLVLQSFLVLDTCRKQAFDEITENAANLFHCPIALISLVDLGRQWFFSSHGLGEVRETPRKVSFCSHTILSHEDFLLVPDATRDSRFFDNAIVTGPPGVRFYAGASLVSPEGYKLGTLCVVDTVARPQGLTEDEKQTLKDMSALVVQRLVIQRGVRTTWFQNLIKTHFPEFEDVDDFEGSSSDGEIDTIIPNERNQEDHDLDSFLESTKELSFKSFLCLLQSQARKLSLPAETVAREELLKATPPVPSIPKEKKVRFSDQQGQVLTETHIVESWKHIKELWWSPDEMHDLRISAYSTVNYYRKHRREYELSIEIVANGTEPAAVVEDHMRKLVDAFYNARGLESRIVRRLSSKRRTVVDAVLEEQSLCRSCHESFGITETSLQEESMAYSQFSSRFAGRLGLCDQVDALKASIPRWRSSAH